MNLVETKMKTISNASMALSLRGNMLAKLSVTVLLVSVCSFTSLAQVSFGVKAGTNVTFLKGSTDRLVRPGFHVGLLARIHVYKALYFIPEVLFLQKGSFDFPLTPAENLRYLEIPLLLTYKPIQFLEINAGFSISSKIDSNPFYRKMLPALSSGLLFNLTQSIFLSGRFNYDLTSSAENTFVNNQLSQTISETITGYSIMLSVGYRINNNFKITNPN
jgi:hypothetical protein